MSGQRQEPASFRGPFRRPLAAALAVLLLLGTTLGIEAAGAQTLDDARADAEALADELADSRERLIELAEEYNRATADLESARERVDQQRRDLDAKAEILEQTRGELRDYAVQAYVSGGIERELDGFFGGDANSVDQRLNYLKTAAGNRKQLLDEVAEARQRVDRQLIQLERAEQEAVAEQARIDASRAEAAELEATTAELLNEAQGRLQTLVAEAEARRAEEERQAALAAMRAAPQPAAGSGNGTTTPVGGGGGNSTTPAAPAPAPAPAPVATPTPAPVAFEAPPGLRPEAAIAVQAALSVLGVPYLWGGSSPSTGFDCSGLMYWAWAQAGVRISRPADYQRDDAVRISYEELQPGDLVFYGEPPSHVGMYVGNDQIVNSPQTGDVVHVKNMFYSSKPMTYGRVV